VIAGKVPAVVVELSELQLVWPAALFAREAHALLDSGAHSREDLGFLLDEAFHDSRGLKLFDQYDALGSGAYSADPWDTTKDPWDTKKAVRPTVQLVRDLTAEAHELRRYTPRRYYSVRQKPPPKPALFTLQEAKIEYAREIRQLAASGYFDDSFGSSCWDADED
jgi:hypothetical protein